MPGILARFNFYADKFQSIAHSTFFLRNYSDCDVDTCNSNMGSVYMRGVCVCGLSIELSNDFGVVAHFIIKIIENYLQSSMKTFLWKLLINFVLNSFSESSEQILIQI